MNKKNLFFVLALGMLAVGITGIGITQAFTDDQNNNSTSGSASVGLTNTTSTCGCKKNKQDGLCARCGETGECARQGKGNCLCGKTDGVLKDK